MSDEEILYNFEKPMTMKAPGIVLTNKRLIHYKPKTFGVELKDYSWRDLHNVSMKEGLLLRDIKFEMIGDHEITLEGIPKDKVREMYALAKEQKEKSHESSKTVVMQQSTPILAPVQEDPVAKLKQLKEMLDAGLVSQDEYDKTKAAILARM
ncbi:MAG: PH domain-containing protein [Methanothrix sp.]|nr:PH domain-containing protein [Methanothrix sp.]MDD4448618.1 PH domain-containing protein [Methanothrix sp.]